MIMIAAAMSGCATDGNKLHVKMDCKGVGDTITVFLGNDSEARQTFTGSQGVFDFTIDVPQVTTLSLAEPGAFRGDRSAHFYQIPAVPGEEAILTQKAGENRYDIDGSRFYAQYHQADLVTEQAQKPINEFMEKCQMNTAKDACFAERKLQVVPCQRGSCVPRIAHYHFHTVLELDNSQVLSIVKLKCVACFVSNTSPISATRKQQKSQQYIYDNVWFRTHFAAKIRFLIHNPSGYDVKILIASNRDRLE